ncbi:MAG: hypothetical protein KF901_34380 [Myxococcales bacterium]|nr:hypothetical protein [Myxococcales bacterium]
MLRSRCAAAIMVMLALSTTGCGASIGASYPLEIPFLRAHNETVMASVPVTPPRTAARYTMASGPLRVVCETETTGTGYVRTKQATFDGAQRLYVGFMALVETALAVQFFWRPAIEHGDVGPWIGAATLQADALFAGGYAIFAPSRSTTSQDYAQDLPQRSGNCPPGVVVTTGGRALPVDPWGRLPSGSAAAGWVVDFGASISLGGRVATWNPTPADRCALAQESHHPYVVSICNTTPPGRPPPPPPPVVPGWPNGTQWNGSISFP